MIVSHKYRFIFLHVPKCAGTSVRNLLLALDPSAESHWDWDWSIDHHRYVDRAHQPLADLCVSPRMRDLLGSYYVFAFTRNPYARFASALREHLKDHVAHSKDSNPDVVARDLSPTNIRYNISYIHFCPQHYFTHLGNKRLVDDVFDVGNAEAGIMRLCDAIKVSPTALEPLQRMNRGAPEETAGDDDLIMEHATLVNDLYAADFHTFGYRMMEIASGRRPSLEATRQNIDLSPELNYRGDPVRFDALRAAMSEVQRLREAIQKQDTHPRGLVASLLRRFRAH